MSMGRVWLEEQVAASAQRMRLSPGLLNLIWCAQVMGRACLSFYQLPSIL